MKVGPGFDPQDYRESERKGGVLGVGGYREKKLLESFLTSLVRISVFMK
jgi:hypothetical protein